MDDDYSAKDSMQVEFSASAQSGGATYQAARDMHIHDAKSDEIDIVLRHHDEVLTVAPQDRDSLDVHITSTSPMARRLVLLRPTGINEDNCSFEPPQVSVSRSEPAYAKCILHPTDTSPGAGRHLVTVRAQDASDGSTWTSNEWPVNVSKRQCIKIDSLRSRRIDQSNNYSIDVRIRNCGNVRTAGALFANPSPQAGGATPSRAVDPAWATDRIVFELSPGDSQLSAFHVRFPSRVISTERRRLHVAVSLAGQSTGSHTESILVTRAGVIGDFIAWTRRVTRHALKRGRAAVGTHALTRRHVPQWLLVLCLLTAASVGAIVGVAVDHPTSVAAGQKTYSTPATIVASSEGAARPTPVPTALTAVTDGGFGLRATGVKCTGGWIILLAESKATDRLDSFLDRARELRPQVPELKYAWIQAPCGSLRANRFIIFDGPFLTATDAETTLASVADGTLVELR